MYLYHKRVAEEIRQKQIQEGSQEIRVNKEKTVKDSLNDKKINEITRYLENSITNKQNKLKQTEVEQKSKKKEKAYLETR